VAVIFEGVRLIVTSANERSLITKEINNKNTYLIFIILVEKINQKLNFQICFSKDQDSNELADYQPM